MHDITEGFISMRNWGVVGVSNHPDKYGYKVYFQLKDAGFNVYAINPKIDYIKNDRCYPSLKDLPIVPDAVNTVVPPNVTEQIIEECASLGIKKIWMQPGSDSKTAIDKAHELGLDIIHNQCILIKTKHMLK